MRIDIQVSFGNGCNHNTRIVLAEVHQEYGQNAVDKFAFNDLWQIKVGASFEITLMA